MDSPRGVAQATGSPAQPVVKVAARTFVPHDPHNSQAAQLASEAREIDTAVGATVLLILEGALLHLHAEAGAVFTPVADEMVSIATISPHAPTYPPPLVKHLFAGSVSGSVLSSGVLLHQMGPGLDDNNRRVPSQLLVPVIARDGRRLAVLQIVGKFRGAVKFDDADEIYATHIGSLLSAVLSRYGVSCSGPQFDPVALHRRSPWVAPTMEREIYDTIPEEMRRHQPAPLIFRTGGTVSLSKRLALTDDAAALSSAPTLREVDCYLDNLQSCWRRSVQLNIEHGQQEQQRLSHLRAMREELRTAKDEAKRMGDRLRLEHLDVGDYRAEYTTLRDELDHFLERKRAFDD
jgi:hypothetical protein